MSCRCVERVLEFHFIQRGHMMVEKQIFRFFCKVCHLNYIYISRSRQVKLKPQISNIYLKLEIIDLKMKVESTYINMYHYTLIVGEHINIVQFSQTCIFHEILSTQLAWLRICQLQSSKSDSFTFFSQDINLYLIVVSLCYRKIQRLR